MNRTELPSKKIGGLPGLSWVWDTSPIAAAMIVLAVDFGIISALMCLEGRPPWARQQALSFAVNDSIFLPLFAAMAVVILRQSKEFQGFYTSKTWHWIVLITGALLSISIEIGATIRGQYSVNQEMSPSKLWHTFIFCVMYYWFVSVVIPVIVSHKPGWAFGISVLAAAGFVYMLYLDAVTPWPLDNHLEGSYLPWSWHPRLR